MTCDDSFTASDMRPVRAAGRPRLTWSPPDANSSPMTEPRKNIVLVGFMGSGKTTVGKLVARRLSLSFLDMDDLIVEREGKPIPKIFSENGEPYFRSLERKLVQELSGREGLVIATGGGIVLNPDNISDFSRTGLVVCLVADAATVLKRVGGDANRPLLSGNDPMARITALMDARRRLYEAIPQQVDTNGIPAGQVADRVIALYR